MLLGDAIAILVTETGLREPDIRGIAACSPEQVMLIMRAYKDNGLVPEKGTWTKIHDVFTKVSEVASLCLPILNAIQIVYSL